MTWLVISEVYLLESYDHQLIVIGGGPAGSTVARYAAEGGVDVLVVDRRDPIGSPLQCGELVPSNDEMRRLCPDVPEMDDLFKTPPHAISRHSTQMHLLPPSGKPLKFDFDGYVLNRVAHDEFLVEMAKEAGANYMTSSRVDRVVDHTVHLRDGTELTAQVIVDAGGHNGPIRSEYWDEKSVKIPVKFALMDGDFGDAVELHFGSMAPGGYAWMFPKGQGANIGLGIQKSFSKGKSLNKFTDEFLSKYDGEITFHGAGSLPMSGTLKRFVKGHYMLVGDSAGMVLPSNGAGITIAMIGGRIAGQVISEHLKTGLPLEAYETRWKKQMGKVMANSKRSFKIGSMMFRLPDWILNMMFNPLTKGIIWRAVTCRRMFWLV